MPSPSSRLLGVEGLGADAMPAVNQPVAGAIGYHIRSGKHDVTDYDWQQYLDFADKAGPLAPEPPTPSHPPVVAWSKRLKKFRFSLQTTVGDGTLLEGWG